MITFGLVLENLFRAVLSRLASALLPSDPGGRKKLARELVALVRNFDMLGELTDEVLAMLHREPPLSYTDDYWAITLDTRVAHASHEMLNTIRRLKDSIAVLDPATASALEVLCESKFSLLQTASGAIDFDSTTGTLSVAEASEALAAVRADSLIRQLQGPPASEWIEWPWGGPSRVWPTE